MTQREPSLLCKKNLKTLDKGYLAVLSLQSLCAQRVRVFMRTGDYNR